MRRESRRIRVVVATLLALLSSLALAGCGSGGDISIPNITIPTTIPTFTIPTITTSGATSSPPVTTTATRTEATGTVTITKTGAASTTTVTSTGTEAPQPASATTAVPPWVWILLALLILALIALIVWLVRRSRARADWDRRMGQARRNALWVEDALVQQVMARASTAEAAATWQAAQPRLMTLDESPLRPVQQCPRPRARRPGHPAAGPARGLVDAMGADTNTGRDASVDDLRARRSAVWRARTDLRSWLDAENARR